MLNRLVHALAWGVLAYWAQYAVMMTLWESDNNWATFGVVLTAIPYLPFISICSHVRAATGAYTADSPIGDVTAMEQGWWLGCAVYASVVAALVYRRCEQQRRGLART